VVTALDLRLDCCEFDFPAADASNGISGRLPTGKLYLGISSSHLGQAGQLSLLQTANEYRPKCGDDLRLGSKGKMAHSIVG